MRQRTRRAPEIVSGGVSGSVTPGTGCFRFGAILDRAVGIQQTYSFAANEDYLDRSDAVFDLRPSDTFVDCTFIVLKNAMQ